ncbi:MAG: glycosyltransferase [Patescibacteria group bacterium]|nr:glycosyltransferase [Patescibacteria group bacterium]
MASELSILIPARNEMFLARTIEDILKNIEADTEIIAVLDGAWANPPIPQHERVNVVFLPQSVGQRAATNIACKLSRAKYVMKVDAHCAFDKGFDRKMIEAFQKTKDNVTMVPIMRNLWAFDWKCLKCGKKWYQGPTPTKCQETNYKGTGIPCDSTKFTRKIMWIGKPNPQSTSYCFDSTPHFQYFEDYKHREIYIKDKKEKGLTETMSLQGSCWMLTREKYWELNVCDEAFGSWGSQGIEVAVKTWLSGGKVLVNHSTWYAHLFRTQGGDFGFPYKIKYSDQKKAQDYARELFFGNKWEKQIYPLSWLVERFWPVKGWSEEDLEKLKANKFEFKNNSANTKTEEIEPTISEKNETNQTFSITFHTSANEAISQASELQKELSINQQHLEKNQETTNNFQSSINTISQSKEQHSIENEKQTIENTTLQIANEQNQDIFTLNVSSDLRFSKSIIYFGANELEDNIISEVQTNLAKISFSKKIPIINICYHPNGFGEKLISDFGLNPSYYLFLRKVLTALYAASSEIIYFCQNTIMYSETHFDFIPKKRLAFYYNVNVLDSIKKLIGTKSLSGLVAYRSTLIKHFEKRLAKIENTRSKALEKGIKLENEGVNRRMVYDPGLTTRKNSLDTYKVKTFKSALPNVILI